MCEKIVHFTHNFQIFAILPRLLLSLYSKRGDLGNGAKQSKMGIFDWQVYEGTDLTFVSKFLAKRKTAQNRLLGNF